MIKALYMSLLLASATLLASRTANAQMDPSVNYRVGSYANYSQVVPTVATTIWPASVGLRIRTVALDTGVAPTVWCAWGTAASNPAVIGSNGFPLSPGFDKSGPGVNQAALNCIQASGVPSAHYVQFETY